MTSPGGEAAKAPVFCFLRRSTNCNRNTRSELGYDITKLVIVAFSALPRGDIDKLRRTRETTSTALESWSPPLLYLYYVPRVTISFHFHQKMIFARYAVALALCASTSTAFM